MPSQHHADLVSQLIVVDETIDALADGAAKDAVREAFELLIVRVDEAGNGPLRRFYELPGLPGTTQPSATCRQDQ